MEAKTRVYIVGAILSLFGILMAVAIRNLIYLIAPTSLAITKELYNIAANLHLNIKEVLWFVFEVFLLIITIYLLYKTLTALYTLWQGYQCLRQKNKEPSLPC